MAHFRVVLETVLKKVTIEEEFIVEAENEGDARLSVAAGNGYEINQSKIIDFGDTLLETPTLVEKVDL